SALLHRPASSLFPYTTLFRSPFRVGDLLQRELRQVFLSFVAVERGVDVGARVAYHLDLADVEGGSLRIAVLRGLPAQVVGDHRRSEEHTSELQSRENLVCRLL